MEMTQAEMKKWIRFMGFLPEDNHDDIFYKIYADFQNYIIRINFKSKIIEYRPTDVTEENGITWENASTCKLLKAESFVVLECVDKLLKKGYAPNSIILEKVYPLGRKLKGRLDIIVTDDEKKSYLMIECKAWGIEYEKEYKKMLRDGGQLFSYYANDRSVRYLCLYTSRLMGESIEYKNDIVPVDDRWAELANVKEIHEHWNKNFKDNGIFEEWSNAYDIEIKALTRGRLKALTKDDSGRIFNQFAEILRHNVVSDKPNAFNKVLNLFICKIMDEDKNGGEQVGFQWLENDTAESLQIRLNDLYKKGMKRFLGIEVIDFSDDEIDMQLSNVNDKGTLDMMKKMLTKLRLQKNSEFAFIEVYDEKSFLINAHIVREVVELLQPYQFRYNRKQQFLGDFFERLLNTSMKQEAGQFFTPVPICRYIILSLPIREFIEKNIQIGEANVLPSVIDFACGTGHFLTEYMDSVQNIIESLDVSIAKPSVRKKLNAWRDYDKYDWAKEYVYGIDADYRLVKSSKVSLFLNGDGEANIIRANGLDHFRNSKDYKGLLKVISSDNSQDNGQFDILIANPPYSVNAFKATVENGKESFELYKYLTDNSSEIECLFVERMKQLLKTGGYAGIILPNTILNGTGIYMAAREIILKYFKVKAITELGPSTFMAANVNTVILFLERRADTDYKQIMSAVNNFFEYPKDMTVLGIEKVFSKYVSQVYGVGFEDYISLANRQGSLALQEMEFIKEYKRWFYSLPDIVKMQDQRAFKEKTEQEQRKELEQIFYDRMFAVEKDKMLYFILTYQQQTVVVRTGEKQHEKSFIGYKFSDSRGHEGIQMLPEGTKLYNEDDILDSKRANSYIYRTFLGEKVQVDGDMSDNVFIGSVNDMIDFQTIQFKKNIFLNFQRKQEIKKWIYPAVRVGNILIPSNEKEERIDSSQLLEAGDYPVISQNSKTFIDGYCTGIEPIKKLPAVLFGDHNCMLKYIDFPFVRGGDGTQIMRCSDEFIPKYFYYALKSQMEYITNMGKYERHYKYLKELYIPCPNLKKQSEIVKALELEEREAECTERKITEKLSAIENIKEDIVMAYPKTQKLRQIAEINPDRPGRDEYDGEMLVSFVEMASVSEMGYIDHMEEKQYKEALSGGYTFFRDEDIILAKITPCMENGKCAFVRGLTNSMGFGSTEFHVIRANKGVILPQFLFLALNKESVRKEAKQQMTGKSGHRRVPQRYYEELQIPIAPIDEQKNILNEVVLLEEQIQQLRGKKVRIVERKKKIFEQYLKNETA